MGTTRKPWTNTNHSLETKLYVWSPKKCHLIEYCRWLLHYHSLFRVQTWMYLCEVTKSLAVKCWAMVITVSADDVTAVYHILLFIFRQRSSYLFCISLNSFFYDSAEKVIIIIITIVRHELVTQTDETNEYWLLTDVCSQFASPKPCRRGHRLVCYYFIVRSFLLLNIHFVHI